MALPYPPGEPLTCAQIREVDVLAIEHVGLPGIVLMENAGRTIAEFIYGSLVNPATARVLVLCGSGNNGGDGFVITRHLRNAGVHVDVALAAPRDCCREDAAVNLRVLERLGQALIDAYEIAGLDRVRSLAAQADVIVDALLGTGTSGPPRGTIAELIRIANAASRARRIAVDIPSGIAADSGVVADPCVRADATVTLVAAKLGFDAPAARAVLGRVVVAEIGSPRELIPGRPVERT